MRRSNLLLLVCIVSALTLPSLSFGEEFTIKLQSYYPAGMMDAEKKICSDGCEGKQRQD